MVRAMAAGSQASTIEQDQQPDCGFDVGSPAWWRGSAPDRRGLVSLLLGAELGALGLQVDQGHRRFSAGSSPGQNSVPCFCWSHGNLNEQMRDTIDDAAHRAGDEARGLRFGFVRRVVLRDRRNLRTT